MKRNFFLLLNFYFLLCSTVFANDPNRISDRAFREPGNDQNSNWSIHYSLGKGSPKSNGLAYTNSEFSFLGSLLDNPALVYLGTKKIIPNIQTYNTRFLAEYLPNHFGFQFGMNYNSINIVYKDNTLALGSLLLFQSSATQNSANNSSNNNGAPNNFFNPTAFLILPLLFNASARNTNFSAHTTTLDFASTIHFRPHKTFDPYLNFGIGIGTCGYACAAGKIFSRLGGRVNLGFGFIFLEGEYNELVVRPSGAPNSVKIYGNFGLLGFGFYL